MPFSQLAMKGQNSRVPSRIQERLGCCFSICCKKGLTTLNSVSFLVHTHYYCLYVLLLLVSEVICLLQSNACVVMKPEVLAKHS